MSERGEQDGRRPLSGEAVVLIHGLLMPAWSMGLLAWRLRRAGAVTRLFQYPSRRAPVARNAAALAAFTAAIEAPTVHWVAHSLGGLVTIRMLRDHPAQRPGRVVLLGTPYRGSAVARHIGGLCWGRWLCGTSLQEALLGDGAVWPGGRELGVIAGTAPIGVGAVIAGLARPHDGVVAVGETEVPGAQDRIALAVPHAGLLLSPAVARQTAVFLAEGRFLD